MEIAIMVEGQMGLTWERWQRMARMVEDLGFAGLFRSDHFTNPQGPDDASLELWVALTWLADNTKRIEFGALVTPLSFRNPVFTARMGYQVDDLSNGRHILGIGAGWQEREHHNFGFDLLDLDARFQRFTEGAEVITRLIREDEPVTYAGDYYTLHDAQLLPRPQRPTPILIGGNGLKRTLPLVARYADEWNGVYLNSEQYVERNNHLDSLLTKEGRDPASVKRSMMTGLFFGKDDARFKKRLGNREITQLRERGVIVGTPSQVQEQLAELAETTGMYRVQLQWFELDDMDGLEAFAKAVL